MYQRNPVIDQLLNIHQLEAEDIVFTASSLLVQKAFTVTWTELTGSFNNALGSEVIKFNPDEVNGSVDRWIADFERLREEEIAKFNRIEEPTFTQRMELLNLLNDIDQHVLSEYNELKGKVEYIDTEFANAARAYRSPLKQALNDITQLFYDINDIEGDFTGFEDVSVYVHGIEDDGAGFLKSAKEASDIGDVLVYEDRDGNVEYYLVIDVEGEKEVIGPSEFKTLDDLKAHKEYQHGEGRLHLVYETEYKNEHRQKSSDDLAEKLIDMGLLNDETKIDMFAHSYGGRRSLQFAMDYPEHVRSLTTIGTPYDKNWLGSAANTFPGTADFLANKNATEYSNYLDFNTKNQRSDDRILHSNVYTDMSSEAMSDDIDHLKTANPEAYQLLEEMEITAAAGRDYTVEYSGHLGISETKRYDTHDGAVSIKSQHGESLGDLIDDRPVYDVKGKGIKNPAHGYEIKNEEFIELIKQVNGKYEE